MACRGVIERPKGPSLMKLYRRGFESQKRPSFILLVRRSIGERKNSCSAICCNRNKSSTWEVASTIYGLSRWYKSVDLEKGILKDSNSKKWVFESGDPETNYWWGKKRPKPNCGNKKKTLGRENIKKFFVSIDHQTLFCPHATRTTKLFFLLDQQLNQNTCLTVLTT